MGTAAKSPTFQCPACQTVGATTDAEAAEGETRASFLRLGWSIFFAMNVMVFTMALWSRDLYDDPGPTTEFANTLAELFRYLALLFSLPVLYLLGRPVLQATSQSLRRGEITTDLLIMLGVFAAFTYSVITVVRGEGHVYFEVACMVLIFLSVGRWLERRGRQQTNESLDALARLLPDEVAILRHGNVEHVPREAAQTGDRLQVFPGERFAIDGRILQGTAEVDEQILTGESSPAPKGPGDLVYSGTLNFDGNLVVEVTAAAGRETISRLLRLIRSARDAKGRHARLADRVAGWFVPIVCLVALAAAAWHGSMRGVDAGILTGLAVLLIACPCALGLATPMAVWTALGRASQSQVLFRSGQSLEDLAIVRAVRLDKTGTITSGRPRVASFVSADQQDETEVLRIAGALASESRHSFSTALAAYAGSDPARPQLTDVVATPGKGVAARRRDNGDAVYLGSRRMMDDENLSLSRSLADRSGAAGGRQHPVVYVGWRGKVRGAFVFEEELRPEALAALSGSRARGLDVAVLTGDHQQRGDEIARVLDVRVQAELLPADKVQAVQDARSKIGPVAMVGDGLNDAPALSAADVGVAMGCGADLSRESAGVCLLSDDLGQVNWAVDLARKTVSIIRQNLFWAFAYNFVGVALAVTGHLNPVWAALAMALSSTVVVSNSLRLARFPKLAVETTP